MPLHLKHGARSSECEKAQHSKKAGLPFLVHAHMLRHSTGYKLAADDRPTRSIQHYLGHRECAAAGWPQASPAGISAGRHHQYPIRVWRRVYRFAVKGGDRFGAVVFGQPVVAAIVDRARELASLGPLLGFPSRESGMLSPPRLPAPKR